MIRKRKIEAMKSSKIPFQLVRTNDTIYGDKRIEAQTMAAILNEGDRVNDSICALTACENVMRD